MADINTYNSLGPRPKAFVIAELLKRAIPLMPMEPTGQPYVVPGNSTEQATWRKFESLEVVDMPAVEGVTPPGQEVTSSDITAKLDQYIGWVGLTDRLINSSEDNIPEEYSRLLAEQFAISMETYRALILRGGTSVFYANGVARSAVNTALTLNLIRKGCRQLERHNAPLFTQKIASTVMYGTESVEPGYIGLVHPDAVPTIRDLAGFQNSRDYAHKGPQYPGEFGAIEMVRFVKTTLAPVIRSAGGAVTPPAFISTNGSNADVYTLIMLGADAWGNVVMRGNATSSNRDSDGLGVAPIDVIRKLPGSGGPEDPANQRGSLAWKTMMTAIILQQTFMTRLEFAVADL